MIDNKQKFFFTIKHTAPIFVAIQFLAAIPAMSNPLNSLTLTRLTLPTPCPGSGCGSGQDGVSYVVAPNTSTGFTATWSAPAQAAWQGAITATATGVSSGPSYPSSAVDDSTTMWNFLALGGGSMAGGGFLPMSTYVYFGDLDSGSGSGEMYTLQGFDSLGVARTVPWLNDPVYISSATTSELVVSSLPEYKWDPSTGTYTFDGNNVPGNPTLGVFLTSSAPLYGLSVHKFTTNNGFALFAPTAAPEPASFVLLGAGLAAFACVKKRRRKA